MAGKDVWIVDAFTERAFAGNSAGVVLDASGLSEPQMQAIAREINSAETTFVQRPASADADVSFCWFTPSREVEFCGHATLAGVHALRESRRVSRDATSLRIDTKHRGVVSIGIDSGGTIWIEVPRPTVKPWEPPIGPIVEVIGATPAQIDPSIAPVITTDHDIILAVVDSEALTSLRPRFSELDELCRSQNLRGILITTRRPGDRALTAHSRFFAPAFGIDEDPVTGSVHAPLGVHLAQSGVASLADGKVGFRCGQGQPDGRGGVVRVWLARPDNSEWRAMVGGTCVTSIRGNLACLPAGMS